MRYSTLLLGFLLLAGPAIARAQQEGFIDVPKDHWAYEAVTDLKMKGILIGYPPSRAPQTTEKSKKKSLPPVHKQPSSGKKSSPKHR